MRIWLRIHMHTYVKVLCSKWYLPIITVGTVHFHVHAYTRLQVYSRLYTRARTHAYRQDIHATVYACVYVYNLTIHITMYTFFGGRGQDGNCLLRRTGMERAKEGLVCVSLWKKEREREIGNGRGEKKRHRERENWWIVKLLEGYLQDSLEKWTLSSIVDDGLWFGSLLPFPFFPSFFSSGLAIPKCCDYEVWVKLAQRTLASASCLIVERAVTCAPRR